MPRLLSNFYFNEHLKKIAFLKKLDNLVLGEININTFEAQQHSEESFAGKVIKLNVTL